MKWCTLLLAIIVLQGANCQKPVASTCDFVENCRTGYRWDDSTCFCERVGMARPTCDVILECTDSMVWDAVKCICVDAPETLPPSEVTRAPPTRPTPPPCEELACRNNYVWQQSVSIQLSL